MPAGISMTTALPEVTELCSMRTLFASTWIEPLMLFPVMSVPAVRITSVPVYDVAAALTATLAVDLAVVDAGVNFADAVLAAVDLAWEAFAACAVAATSGIATASTTKAAPATPTRASSGDRPAAGRTFPSRVCR
jgi:hypothetical protein